MVVRIKSEVPYDPDYGFGDDVDGDYSSIAPDTELKVGDQYPFVIKFYPVDGYNYTKLEKEDITLVTPYGTCTATRFRRGFSENSYWLTFDLPAIGSIETKPITSVTISDLTKPVVGEMPDNSITVNGTGVTVDTDGSYWGRFDSTRFSPYYGDGTTAVKSVVFRDGETYVFQLYLNAATGYEFTADSKFVFSGKELPALDMTDLSKTGAMVNPSDSTQAIVYINMNDIPDGAPAPLTYDLWVGGTQVTEANKGDILGDGKAKYDPDTKTLTLTGNTLTNVYNDALIYVKDMELIINAPSGLTLDNTANDGPAIYAYGSHDLTVNGNVDLKADAAPAIVCGKNLTINGNAKANSVSSAVLTASGSVTINGNATINSGSSAPGIYADADIVLNGSAHEVNSSLLGSAAVTITGDFKSTVTGNAPAIKGNEVSITGKVDITSDNSLGIAVSNKVSIKGDTKIEAKQMAISVNAGSVVLEGTKHELTSTEAPGIYCSGDITIKGAVIATAGPQAINSTGGTVTIDGDVTATSTAAPAITAKTIEVKSGTWTLSGNPMAMYAESIVIPDTHEIVKPEGAKLNDEKTCIVESDGTTIVSGATIAPKAGAAKTLDSIAITTPPAKTAYTTGESFDSTGMVVTATYSDRSTAPVMGYTVSPAGALSESETENTVTYTEDGVAKTATQTITVTAASGSGGIGSSGSGGGYTYYTIKATAGVNGAISSSGSVRVRQGKDQTFTITPDKGYAISDVKIDGKSVGAVKSYTFENVKGNHTIKAIFMKANGNPQTGVFVDVPEGSYYEEAVAWAVENGITKGTSDTTFEPNGICTRAQAVTFLWRAAGSPAPKTSTMPFTDVKAGSYYYDAVLWAVENGITNGTSATAFSPNVTCTRAQIVTFLWRSQRSPAADSVNPFTDVAVDAYYNTAVL